jgi:ATP-dependent helicase/nuclease subunit A
MFAHFQRAHRASGLPLDYCEFKHSLRSGPNILDAVDKMFEPEEIHRSVTSDADGVPLHIALPDAAPGWSRSGTPSSPRRSEIEA